MRSLVVVFFMEKVLALAAASDRSFLRFDNRIDTFDITVNADNVSLARQRLVAFDFETIGELSLHDDADADACRQQSHTNRRKFLSASQRRDVTCDVDAIVVAPRREISEPMSGEIAVVAVDDFSKTIF